MRINNNLYDVKLDTSGIWGVVEKHLLETKKKIQTKKYKTCLNILLCNFLQLSENDKLVIPLTEYRNCPLRYNLFGVKYSVMSQLLSVLAHLGYVKIYKGKKNKNFTVVYVYDRLFSDFNYFRKYVVGKSEFIILKNKDKKLEDYKDSRYTRMSRIIISKYNEFLSKVSVLFEGEQLINTYHRIFNGDFESGGRYFRAGILGLKSRERLDVTIDGQPVIEVDYVSMHIAALLAKEGKSLYYDPYGYYEDRKVAKRVLNIALCSKSRPAAIKAIINQQEEGSIPKKIHPEKILDVAIDENRYLCNNFFSDDGLHCMFIESEIMTDVISTCIDLELPVLIIHDCVLCREVDKNVVGQIMAEAFQEYFDNKQLNVFLSFENKEDKVVKLFTQEEDNVFTMMPFDELVVIDKQYDERSRRKYAR